MPFAQANGMPDRVPFAEWTDELLCGASLTAARNVVGRRSESKS